MMKELFFDTETSGFAKTSWICQLGFIFRVDNTPVAEGCLMIQSAGRPMPKAAQEIHGIPTTLADEGIPARTALSLFMTYVEKADLLICHNYAFDCRMVQQDLRYCGYELAAQQLLTRPSLCTMKTTTDFCGLRNKANRPKWPKLEELHTKLFGSSFDGAHNAMADVQATIRCYDELRRLGVLSA